jgi:polysaccharide pyruvyl transferase CsaB
MTIGGQLFQILKELSRCDIFFFGGGGLLKDNTSPQNVLKLLDEAFLAKLLKKKLVFGGVGVGPVVTGFGKWLIKMAANVADQIFVRDQLSRTRLLEIGIRDSKIRVAGDIGILLRKKELLYGHPLRKLLQEIENSCFKKVGICLCDYGLRSHLLEDESPESDKLFRALGKFCDWLVENINAKLLFIPFMTEYWDDDRKTAIRVKSEMKRGESAYEVKSILSPRELKWVLGKLDYVIGARLHSIVLAASEGVPAVALSYDAKVRGFMEEMDLKTFIIDVGSLDPERMIEIFKNIENGRGNYIDRMKPNAEAMKKAVTEMLNEALRLP